MPYLNDTIAQIAVTGSGAETHVSTIYEERIYSRWLTTVLAIVTCFLLGVFIYQILEGPVGTRPAPEWIFLAVALLLLATTVNFSTLTIRLTMVGIFVGYGIVRHHIPWSNVVDCYQDKASTVWYGGFGIHLGLVNGKWRLVYNTIGHPRVVIRKRQGRIQEFVFLHQKSRRSSKSHQGAGQQPLKCHPPNRP